MKIALVAQHATPVPGDSAQQAGDDTRLVEMSRSLAANGHQVTVYARRGSAARPERARLAPGVSVEYVGPADSAADAGRSDDAHLLAQVAAFSQPLHDRWSKDRPDVVHALRWTSGLAALSATRDLQVPVVQTFDSLGVTERRHRMIPASVGTERIRLEPAIGRTVSAVMAGSSDEESDLTRLGVPRRSIRVVPCGVDTDEFSPEGPPTSATQAPPGDRWPTSPPSRTRSVTCCARCPRCRGPSSSWPAARRATGSAATCPTAGWPSWPTPST